MSDHINRDFRFDPVETAGSTVFLMEGDKVAYLHEPLLPPVGTLLSLPRDVESEVESVRLDLSNSSELAMVYVTVKKPRSGKMWSV